MPAFDPLPPNARSARTRIVTTTVTEPLPDWESLKAASFRTDISVHTLREKIACGELRAYRFSDKPGSAFRLKRTDVDALFKPVIPDEIYAERRV